MIPEEDMTTNENELLPDGSQPVPNTQPDQAQPADQSATPAQNTPTPKPRKRKNGGTVEGAGDLI